MVIRRHAMLSKEDRSGLFGSKSFVWKQSPFFGICLQFLNLNLSNFLLKRIEAQKLGLAKSGLKWELVKSH